MKAQFLSVTLLVVIGACVAPYQVHARSAALGELFKKPKPESLSPPIPFDKDNILDKVVSFVKKAVEGKTAAQWKEQLIKHLYTVRLVKQAREPLEWEVPAVAAIAEQLLRAVDSDKFIDRIKGCALQNSYLMRYLADPDAAKLDQYKVLSSKVIAADGQPTDEAKQVLFEAVAYTVLQDRIVKAFRKDKDLFAAAFQHMIDTRKKFKMEDQSLFERLKIATMDAVFKSYHEIMNGEQFDGTWGRTKLIANILEATGDDFFKGYRDNARAGWALQAYPAGASELHPKTGLGPTAFAGSPWPPKTAVLRLPPFPEQWADLYSTWNLDFCAKYPDWPFFFAKLLNPGVFCYHNGPHQVEPGLYLFSRGIGLLLHIQFEYFRRYDRGDVGGKHASEDPVQWTDEHMLRVWGRNNAQSAVLYEEMVERAEPGLLTKFKNGWEEIVEGSKHKAEELRAWFKGPLAEKFEVLLDQGKSWIHRVAQLLKTNAERPHELRRV